MSRSNAASLVLAGGALVIALSGVAVGAPGDDGMIHACYQLDTRALSVRDAGETCDLKTQKALTWNLQGAKGDAGPPGQDATISSPVLKALAEWQPRPDAPIAQPRRVSASERKLAIAELGYRSGSERARAVPVARVPTPRIMTAVVSASGYVHPPHGPDAAVTARSIRWVDGSLLPDFFQADATYTGVLFNKPVTGCTATVSSISNPHEAPRISIMGVGSAPHELREAFPSVFNGRRLPYTVTVGTDTSDYESGTFSLVVVCDPRNEMPRELQVPVAREVPPPPSEPMASGG